MADLSPLVELSRRFGSDPDWVLAGGGNTSFKDRDRLYVKASGASLASIGPEGFCAIDRSRLDAIWSAAYPEDGAAREAAALADLMASRCPGESKRPSVETLMHGLFPQAYVVHTHPSAINGLGCSREGEAAFKRLFGEEGIWIPCVDPGYVLAKTVRLAFETFAARRGSPPSIMFMQNHGLLVAAEDPAGIERISLRIMRLVLRETRREPDLRAVNVDPFRVEEAIRAIVSLAGEGAVLRFRSDAEILARSASPEAFGPLSSAFTPDHIVYAGSEFLLDEGGNIGKAWADYLRRNGVAPRILIIHGLGAFSCGRTEAAAEAAMLLFTDACKVAAYAESFGGARHMPRERIDFIRNWEVERYRSSISTGE